MSLTCPKCQGEMRQYERNGVTVDQCAECRGIFLDRGELERLVDAERVWQREPEPVRPYQERPDDRERSSGSYQQGYGKPRRKKSFMEQLFD